MLTKSSKNQLIFIENSGGVDTCDLCKTKWNYTDYEEEEAV